MTDAVPVVMVDHLDAGYGAKHVLTDIVFSITRGEWVVLLGPNGSGKSTLLKTLMGILIPSAGEARILGYDSCVSSLEVRRQTAYLPEEHFLYSELNSRQHLAFIADIFELDKQTARDRGDRLLEQLGLTEAGNHHVSTYSQGMKKKLALAMALLHKPLLMVLDEPFNGLDPAVSHQLRQAISKLCREQGTTVLMSTHNLGMAHRYADRLLIIHDGKLHFNGSPKELMNDYPDKTVEEIFIEIVDCPGELELSL